MLFSDSLIMDMLMELCCLTLWLVAHCFFTMQRRWVEEDIKNMELLAETITREGEIT